MKSDPIDADTVIGVSREMLKRNDLSTETRMAFAAAIGKAEVTNDLAAAIKRRLAGRP